MIRPLVYILTYLLLGIVFGQHFYTYKFVALFAIFIFATSIFISLSKKMLAPLLLICVSIFGFIIGNYSLRQNDNTLYNMANDNQKHSISCEVLDLSKKYDNSFKYIVKINNSDNYKCNSKALLFTNKNLNTGDNISLYEKLRIINKKANPTDFDSYSYYKSCNIEYKIYSNNIKIISHIKNFNSTVKSIRNYFSNLYSHILPEKEASFVRAIVLGDKADLDENLYNSFKEAGIVHILAISGIHISILAGGIFLILRRHKYLSYIITILFLIFYCIFTGMSPSVMRASFMTFVIIACRFIGRDYDIISSASLSCIIMLILNPYSIYNSGFCYTYICTFGIGMVADIIVKYNIDKLKFSNIIVAALISITACVAAKPFTIYEYYYVNIYDIISNLLIVPFMTITLLLSLLSAVFGAFNIWIGRFLIGLPYVLINYYEKVCNYFNNLPYHNISTGGISIITLIAIYLTIIIIYNVFMKFIKARYVLIPVLIFIIIFINNSISPKTYYENIDTDKINTLFIKNEENILINFGSKINSNYGEYRVLKYLSYKNIDHINKLYITKTDYNHIGGLFETANKIKINKIYILNNCKRNDILNRVLTIAKDNSITVEYVNEDSLIFENIKLKSAIKLVEKQ